MNEDYKKIYYVTAYIKAIVPIGLDLQKCQFDAGSDVLLDLLSNAITVGLFETVSILMLHAKEKTLVTMAQAHIAQDQLQDILDER